MFRKMSLDQAIAFFTIGHLFMGAKKFLLTGRTELDLAFEVENDKVVGVVISDKPILIAHNRIKVIEIAREREGRLLIDIESKPNTIYDAKILTDIIWFAEIVTTKVKGCVFYSIEDVILGKIGWQKILGYVDQQGGNLTFTKLGQLSIRETVDGNYAVIVDGNFGIIDKGLVDEYFAHTTPENRAVLIDNATEIGTDFILSRTTPPFLAMAVNGKKTAIIDGKLEVKIYDTPKIWAMAAVKDDGEIAKGFYHVFAIDKTEVKPTFDVPLQQLVPELRFLAEMPQG